MDKQSLSGDEVVVEEHFCMAALRLRTTPSAQGGEI